MNSSYDESVEQYFCVFQTVCCKYFKTLFVPPIYFGFVVCSNHKKVENQRYIY